MTHSVRCGCGDYAHYGVISIENGAYVFDGEVKTLRNMLVIAEKYAGHEASHEDVLETMVTLFDDRLWAKYNHFHGSHGRFSSEGGALSHALEKSGGFTYSPLSQSMPKDGLLLSLHPERSHVLSLTNVTGEAIHDYISKNKDILQAKNTFVGAWHDTETHKVYLDISTRLEPTEHAKAIRLSIKYKQRAYYDIGQQKEIRVMDESHAHEAASRPAPETVKATDNAPTVILQGLLTKDATLAECEALAQAIHKQATDTPNL